VIASSSTGFNRWGFVLARTKTHRLKPVLLDIPDGKCRLMLI
jgi:hypothetical protein